MQPTYTTSTTPQEIAAQQKDRAKQEKAQLYARSKDRYIQCTGPYRNFQEDSDACEI